MSGDVREDVWALIINRSLASGEKVNAIIARVRADERARWSPPAPATPGHVAWCYCPVCFSDHVVDEEVQE